MLKLTIKAAVLKADAEKKKRILEAEGEAQAILSVQKATADGIKAIRKQELMRQFLHLRVLKLLQQQQTVRLQRLLFHLKFRELPVQ